MIRKNDIAIATETIPIPPPEPKPRLIHMVACKTVGEYRRNQEKIRKFCLEEAKAIKKAKSSNQRNSPGKTHPDKPVQQIPQQSQPKLRSKTETKWTKDKLVKLATHNPSRQQSKSKTQPRPQSPMLKKKFKSSTPKHSFNYKAQQAALMESANAASSGKASSSKTAQPPSEVSNRSFLIFNFDNEADQSNIQTHYIESDNPDTPPHVIHTSDNPVDFMRTSPNSPPIYPMDTTTPDGENIQAEPPLISIIPAPSYEPTPHGETDTYGTNRDEFTKSTFKLDRMINKIRSTQGEHTWPTTTAQVHEPEKMEQSSTQTKAPEIIYLDSSNSSQEITRNSEDQRLPPQAEIYNSPYSSSIYKIPPSSPKCDSISDLNDDDIQELNKNF